MSGAADMGRARPGVGGFASRFITSYRRGYVVPAIIVLTCLAATPFVSNTLALKLILWISFAYTALSLDFLWGRGGIFSFGQTALFGIGGYGYAIIALNVFPQSGETLSALLGAGVAGAAAAIALGYFLFYGRLSDVYLSIVTLAVTLIIYTVLASTAGPEYHVGEAYLGGFNGIPSLPTIAFPAALGGDGELSIRQLLAFAVVLAGILYTILDQLGRGRFGLMMDGLRSNELRMELLGYDVRRFKLVIYSIGGAVSGLGGGVFAAWGTFINPSVFSLAQAASVVVWVMIGGRGSLIGAFVGVFIVQSAADAADLVVSQQTPLLVGLLLIIVVTILPDGVVPAIGRALGFNTRGRRRIGNGRIGAAGGTRAGDGRGRLMAADITKHFGGLSVLRGVSSSFGDHAIHAIIGPNGAGKSTFFNILMGRFSPDRGEVLLNALNVSRLPTHLRCRRGLGIKMQVPCVFQDLTVRENVALAVLASAKAVGVDEALSRVGLQNRIDDLASTLSHGEQQWLEMALVLAQNPSVILLDEPGAGMGDDDKRRTVELIHNLSEHHTLIVVEHDMAFIQALKAPVLMLHQGVVFRSGSFEELVGDSTVIDAYLGRRRHAHP
jgi:branched-chain amino acid transport system permease protein